MSFLGPGLHDPVSRANESQEEGGQEVSEVHFYTVFTTVYAKATREEKVCDSCDSLPFDTTN